MYSMFRYMEYRSTPHTSLATSSAELLYDRKMRTKLPEFVGNDAEQERQSIHQETFDQDAERKQCMADHADNKV